MSERLLHLPSPSMTSLPTTANSGKNAPNLTQRNSVNTLRLWCSSLPQFTQITCMLGKTSLGQSFSEFPLSRVEGIEVGLLRRGWLKTLENPDSKRIDFPMLRTR